MSARSTRGPGGGKIHGRRPPVRRGGGRKAKQSGCAMIAIPAAVLAVVSVSIALTPFGVRVWASQSMTSWAWHGPLMVALLLAAAILYLTTSLFLTRLAVPPAGPRDWGARSSRPGPAPEPIVSAPMGTAGSGATGGAM
ncbi:MAG TPA: hypothetical protein VFY84_14115 [Jiangellales bacterium]|nr:hypothetical protein [Jiangellales bacterium]